MSSELEPGAYQSGVEVGPFMEDLFCLKRNFTLSNLTPVECIKTVRRAKTNEELKVAQINLFDSDGEITILELWNEDAVDGVRYLWDLLGSEDAILLKISKLTTPTDAKERRASAYRIVPPTSFMLDNFSFPVKSRIIAQTPLHGQTCDLKKQCKRITISDRVQLLCDGLPLRHFSQWHKTIQEQYEEDDPDDLQKLIYRATGLSMLGKRNEADEPTQADKGYTAMNNNGGKEQNNDAKMKLNNTAMKAKQEMK